MSEPPATWLFKTEPSVFSMADLLKAPDRVTGWEGVRNFQARNIMRDQVCVGDMVLIYHSSCPVPGVVGLARVVRAAYPDLTALDPRSPYFDEFSFRRGASRWLCVDVQGECEFAQPLTLAKLRAMPEFAGLPLLRRGNRLSIQPVSRELFDRAMAILVQTKPYAVTRGPLASVSPQVCPLIQ